MNSQFMKKFLEVRSAVGSGCAFFKGHGKKVPDTYRKYALEGYSIYAYYLLGIETGISHPTLVILSRPFYHLTNKPGIA